jgi:DNA-binding transcriptional MerR regulator
MRIGELSRRSGIPVRMLRYYEEKGLLAPVRAPNGYREYAESDVDRAGMVRSLIRSGLPTKLIIPLLQQGDTDADLASLLAAEEARLDARITCMTLSRDTIRAHLRRLQATAA